MTRAQCQFMLNEIDAITQLLLVLQVGYLMLHCRAFRNQYPNFVEDLEYRSDRADENQQNIASLLDEIAESLYPPEEDEAHPPFDLKSQILQTLIQRFANKDSHGSTQSEIRPVPEGDSSSDKQMEKGSEHSSDSVGSSERISNDETIV